MEWSFADSVSSIERGYAWDMQMKDRDGRKESGEPPMPIGKETVSSISGTATRPDDCGSREELEVA